MNRLLYCLTKTKRCAPRFVGFSVIIFIVFTIAWTRKHSVFTSFVKFKKERGSWGFRRTCSCWGKKRRMLSSFWWSFPGALLVFGSFWRKDCGCMFFSDFCSHFCRFSKLNNFSQVFSEPNVCCKTTETSVLSKVTSMRLPENTYFFPGEKIAILTFYLYFTKCETAWHGGWPFNRARNCRNSKERFRDYDKFCESCAFWMGVFVEFLMKICFSCYTISATLYFSLSFFSLNLFVRESFRKQLRWAWVVQNTIVGCFSFLHPRKKLELLVHLPWYLMGWKKFIELSKFSKKAKMV